MPDRILSDTVALSSNAASETQSCQGRCFDSYLELARILSTPVPNEPPRAVESSESPFVYDKIDQWQTRLVLLHVGAANDEIEGSLVNVDLIVLDGAVLQTTRELVQYRALSYCWGTERKTRSIYLERQRVPNYTKPAFGPSNESRSILDISGSTQSA